MPARVDAHQHFWTYDPGRYPWIGEDMDVLRRDFGPGDLAPLAAKVGIDGTVAVQARQDEDETRWLFALAREHDLVRGVVGWVDLCAPDVGDRLDALHEEGALVGVRHVLQDEPDEDYMLRPDFRRGIGLLAERGLTYDILIYPRHLKHAVTFVDEFPEQPFVLDHLAKPFIRDGKLDPWRAQLLALAERPNVSCKVSGMVTEADWEGWKPLDLLPYMDFVLEVFGEERSMFGSDWPVCTLAATYEEVHAVVDDWASSFSDEERAMLFGGNAVRFYGIGA